jgi:DNA-binding CsgD family transcriptional regulator
MKLIVFSVSRSFEQFLNRHLDIAFEYSNELQAPSDDSDQLYLLHISGMELECYEWLLKHVSGKPIRVGVCSDLPNIREMLECVRLGAVENGQSWFPPQMLDETFKLAQQAANPTLNQEQLEILTAREKDIALAVGDGKSNRQIADLFDISEPTVKSHLTSIFKKLDLKDRVGLVLYLKQA